jgi:hypothetical protein
MVKFTDEELEEIITKLETLPQKEKEDFINKIQPHGAPIAYLKPQINETDSDEIIKQIENLSPTELNLFFNKLENEKQLKQGYINFRLLHRIDYNKNIDAVVYLDLEIDKLIKRKEQMLKQDGNLENKTASFPAKETETETQKVIEISASETAGGNTTAETPA